MRWERNILGEQAEMEEQALAAAIEGIRAGRSAVSLGCEWSLFFRTAEELLASIFIIVFLCAFCVGVVA